VLSYTLAVLFELVMPGLAAFAKASAAERTRWPGEALAETGAGHPRLFVPTARRTWMA
jgi:hypothetical protein